MRSANITWYCSRRRKGSASEEQTFQWEGIPLCQQPWEARTPTHFWPWRTWNMEQTQKSNKNKVLAERIQLALGKEKNQRKESEKKTKNIGECAALGRGVLEPRASMGVMEGAGRKRNVQRSVGGLRVQQDLITHVSVHTHTHSWQADSRSQPLRKLWLHFVVMRPMAIKMTAVQRGKVTWQNRKQVAYFRRAVFALMWPHKI